MIRQSDLMHVLGPTFEESGILYEKTTEIRARVAIPGEVVHTITSDGPETANIAVAGDYVVENQTGSRERYIVSGDKFGDRYERIRDESDGWVRYRSKGRVLALEVDESILADLGLESGDYIETPWADKSPVRRGDFMAAPENISEIYRIGRKEFLETYRRVT